jgi:hypothetical protein
VTCSRHKRDGKDSYSILVVKPEGRRPLETPRHRWEDIRIREVGWGDVDRIHLAKNQWWALVNTVMKIGFQKRQGIS